jgi:hypothetical protein
MYTVTNFRCEMLETRKINYFVISSTTVTETYLVGGVMAHGTPSKNAK